MITNSLIGYTLVNLTNPPAGGSDSLIGWATVTLQDPASPYVMMGGAPVEIAGHVMVAGAPMTVRRWRIMEGGVAAPLVRPSLPEEEPMYSTLTHNRNGVAWGDVEPTTATAGLVTPEASLTEYNSPSTQDVTIPDGATIEAKIIYGRVQFAGNATLRDCLLVGRSTALTSSNDGVVHCINTRTGQAKLFDCEIRPRKESPGRNCTLGDQYELYGCWLHGGEDGAGIYPRPAGATVANVVVAGCLIEDLSYFYPDRDHGDGSHCDGIQIQGGTSIHVIGNSIRGTGHWGEGSSTYYTEYPNAQLGDWPLTKTPARIPGSNIIIANGVSAPFDSTVIIEKNWLRHGKAQLLVKSSANNFVCTNNRFSAVNPPASNVYGTVANGVPLNFTANPYWIRFDSVSSSGNVSGLTAGGSAANTTNVWLDGGSQGGMLAMPRASGIHSDA